MITALDVVLFVVLIAIGMMLDVFYSIPLRTQTWAISIVIFVLLIRVLRGQREIVRKEEAIMGQDDDLMAAVKAAADEEASLETRVDGLIAALKQPHDSPIVAQAIADLEAMKSREAGYQAPPPPPPPATV